MGGKHRTTEELKNVVETILEVPRKEGETQRQWFERLSTRYGLNRSRSHLQYVMKAMETAGTNDIDRINEELQKIQQKRGKKEEEKPEEPEAEEQIPGQIEMELEPGKPEMSDQTKMMRFQAAQVDKLIVQYGQWMDVINMRMEKLNDTMSMVLRAIRRD